MHVTAFGPARILHDKDFLKADNYLTPFDPVPLLDVFGIFRGLKKGNVHYSTTTGCPVIDHYYDNREFEKIRLVKGNAFKNEYGDN